MSGIVLDTTEFAYLLATIHAKEVIGVDDPALFPATPEAQETTYKAGLEKLKTHGWLKPLENNQFHLSDTLLLLVATIADPQMAIISANTTANGGGRVLTHYLVDADIVELGQTGPDEYTLGIVPDHATLFAHIANFVEVRAETPAQGMVTLDVTQFDKLQALAGRGEMEQTTQLLKEVGLNGQSADLAGALAAPSCQVVVVKAALGKVEAGRRATILRGPQGTWLAQRTTPEAATLTVETIQPAELANVLEGYINTLTEVKA